MASGRCAGQRPDGHTYISLYILTFSNGCILLTFESIYTKLCKAWSALYDYVALELG